MLHICSCVLIPNGVCLVHTVGPRWSRILSVSALNMLAGSTASLSLSLSLSLCMKICLLAAQSTAPSNGRGAGPHRPICALGLLVSVDGICFFAWHQVLVGRLAPPHQWSAAPSHGGGAGPHHLVCIKISLVLLRRLRIDHMTVVSIA